MDGRKAALDAAAAKLDPYPYDRATFTGNGIALQCLWWPPTLAPDPAPAGELPDVPTLLFAGDKDLSTPMEWAQAAVKHAPGGKLIVAKGAGHGVQSQRRRAGAGRPARPRSIAGVIDELIRTRRTHKAFGPDPVPRETLLELFELARWAPNHHLTDPWRFRVLGEPPSRRSSRPPKRPSPAPAPSSTARPR